MERIGIYGGTFNPPHIGHIYAAEYAVEALHLQKLLLVPSCIAPHKMLPSDSPTPLQRAQMLQIAARGRMEVCEIEINRGGTSYTYETVEKLSVMYPNQELVLLMGTDMFLSFFSWKETERILKKVSIGVFYRGSTGEAEQIAQQKTKMEDLGTKVYLIENPVTAISSTQLRRLLVFRCANSFLPAGVETYIREHGLYGTAKDYRGLSMEELEKTVVSLLKPIAPSLS